MRQGVGGAEGGHARIGDIGVEYAQVAFSSVESESVALVVPAARVPAGAPSERTGGVVSTVVVYLFRRYCSACWRSASESARL